MTDLRLRDLPSVPESALADAVLAALPATTPPAPWRCRVRATVWLQRAEPPAGTPFDGALLLLTMGAFVDYLDSPVGPYREVFAGPVVRGGGLPSVHVPFIAVDSLPSVHGGRAHWGLPKTVAAFTGDVGTGHVTATGDGWSVTAASAVVPVRLPVAAAFRNAQEAGRARVVLRGRVRPARVAVAADGPSLRGWLAAGRHPGVVGEGRLVVHPPR